MIFCNFQRAAEAFPCATVILLFTTGKNKESDITLVENSVAAQRHVAINRRRIRNPWLDGAITGQQFCVKLLIARWG